MQTLHLKAPAKVNLRLEVLRRRPDGYHDLRMVMQRIALYDDIGITVGGAPGIRVSCGRKGVPDGPGNIAWRAADLLVRRSGTAVGLDIAITKNIPVAAGLGGGSSDAASVLMGCNELLELGLTDEDLREIGVTLGADVPFFIFRKPAIAEGIGDIFTPLQRMPPVWLVLVNPGIPVSTAWVYQNLHLTSERESTKIPLFYESVRDVCDILANDLESVTVQRFPLIREIKERLLITGAGGALMSGSGPTVFGIYEDEATARRVHAELQQEVKWFTAVMQTLA